MRLADSSPISSPLARVFALLAECVALFVVSLPASAGRRASWPLRDAGGDVIALADLGGSSNSARIVTEIVYDAYGRVLAREDRSGTTPPDLRLGHKGLFFDRLDGGSADPLTFDDTRRLESGSRLLGFVRNRSLHTQWGRWLQRDPNATGMVVASQLNCFGGRSVTVMQALDLKHHVDRRAHNRVRRR